MYVLTCVLAVALVLGMFALVGCQKSDEPADSPSIEQGEDNTDNQPIESNPVETYVEEGDAPE